MKGGDASKLAIRVKGIQPITIGLIGRISLYKPKFGTSREGSLETEQLRVYTYSHTPNSDHRGKRETFTRVNKKNLINPDFCQKLEVINHMN
jgi:hypothetical protein